MDKYAEIIGQAREEFGAARAALRVEAEAAAALRAAAAAMAGELEALRGRITAFEAGQLDMPADEYLAAADRRRWLEVKARQMGVTVAQADRKVATATGELQGVAGKWRTRLGRELAADAEERARLERARLESVLK